MAGFVIWLLAFEMAIRGPADGIAHGFGSADQATSGSVAHAACSAGACCGLAFGSAVSPASVMI